VGACEDLKRRLAPRPRRRLRVCRPTPTLNRVRQRDHRARSSGIRMSAERQPTTTDSF
jgi:hypothetical protein